MLGRRASSIFVAALVAGSLTFVVASPAAAAPTVTVTPSTGLVDGQQVTISLTDLPTGLWAVLQCAASFDLNTQSVFDHCNFLVVPTEGTPPASVTADVKASLSVSGSPIDCATVIDACKVVASTYDTPSNSYVSAEAPISFEGAVPPPPPTVNVTPTLVTDGQAVTITAAGFPSGTWGIAQCPTGLTLDSTGAIFANCRWMVGPGNGIPPASSQSVVYASYLSIDGTRTVDCLLEMEGCSVGVGVLVGSTIVSASVPLDFGSTLHLEPARGLTDGSTVSGFTSAADGDYTLAQCSASVLDQGSSPSDALCGPTTAVIVTSGAIDPSFTVDEPLVTRDDTSIPCGSHGCVLVLQTGGGDLEGSAAVSFGPPALATDPPLPVPQESLVTVLVSGMEGTSVDIARCVEPISPDRCYGAATITLDAWGSGSAANVWLPASLDADGTTYDCRVASCVLVAGDPAAPQAVLPISFTPPPVVTLTPSTGLLDGEAMQLDATGLRASAEYSVWRCTPARLACDEVSSLVSGPDGAATTDVTAQQRVGTFGYCRTACEILLVYSGVSDAVATFDMAVGSLAVAPSTGLVPGQTVGLTGSSLMPTYLGPNLGPFPTGGWAIGQCDAAVVGNVSLGSVFQHCSLGPSLQRVTIDGSALDVTATVEGVITKILGGTTDCTATPGACVLGLFRLEQDVSTSGYTVPLAFG